MGGQVIPAVAKPAPRRRGSLVHGAPVVFRCLWEPGEGAPRTRSGCVLLTGTGTFLPSVQPETPVTAGTVINLISFQVYPEDRLCAWALP